MIHVAGGVYRENCMHPSWREVYGSGGRAVSAIMQIGGEATLHSFVDASSDAILRDRAAFEGFGLNMVNVDVVASFSYHHALAVPTIKASSKKHPPIELSQDKVIRF
jgi:hypothetical protein